MGVGISSVSTALYLDNYISDLAIKLHSCKSIYQGYVNTILHVIKWYVYTQILFNK